MGLPLQRKFPCLSLCVVHSKYGSPPGACATLVARLTHKSLACETVHAQPLKAVHYTA